MKPMAKSVFIRLFVLCLEKINEKKKKNVSFPTAAFAHSAAIVEQILRGGPQKSHILCERQNVQKVWTHECFIPL